MHTYFYNTSSKFRSQNGENDNKILKNEHLKNKQPDFTISKKNEHLKNTKMNKAPALKPPIDKLIEKSDVHVPKKTESTKCVMRKSYMPPSDLIVRVDCPILVTAPEGQVWEKKIEGKKISTGFAVKLPNHELIIVMNAHGVKDCITRDNGEKIVAVMTHEDEKFDGKVVMENDYIDIAFVRPVALEDKSILRILNKIKDVAVPLDSLRIPSIRDIKFPKIGMPVTIKGYSCGQKQLTVTHGNITSISDNIYVHKDYFGITISIDATVASGNSGGPVFDEDGIIIGIVFEGYESNYFIIPFVVLEVCICRYINLSGNDTSTFVRMGELETNLTLQGVETEDEASFYHLQPEEKGMRVVKDCRELRADDVIVEVEGLGLNERGVVLVNAFEDNTERVPFDFRALCILLTEMNPNLEFTVVRTEKGITKRFNIKHRCGSTNDLVAKYFNEDNNDYIDILGQTIRPLSLEMFMEDIQTKSFTVDELHALVEGKKRYKNETALVFRVTGNTSNAIKYMPHHNAIIKEINGIEPRNLAEAAIALKQPVQNKKRKFIRIKFANGNLIVLNEDRFEDENAKMALETGMTLQLRCSEFLSRKRCLCNGDLCEFEISKTFVTCAICKKKVAALEFKDNHVTMVSPSK
ncbi:hypothetical protein MHBO_000978 [Bonamia ostreae]|uniref:Protease Do-like PDZ domain-containing protein n=1 Tax=Bonamia ostreae TaxID=126728 RepID=A0ABV2AHF9_9EUKA